MYVYGHIHKITISKDKEAMNLGKWREGTRKWFGEN